MGLLEGFLCICGFLFQQFQFERQEKCRTVALPTLLYCHYSTLQYMRARTKEPEAFSTPKGLTHHHEKTVFFSKIISREIIINTSLLAINHVTGVVSALCFISNAPDRIEIGYFMANRPLLVTS